MASAYRSVAALLVSVFLMLVANGVVTTTVPLAARAHGHSEIEIGLLGSAYFCGMLLGAMLNPWLIRHAGHVRVFTGSIAVATIAVLGFSLFETAWAWIVFRGAFGFCFAGLYATVEGWLQAKSDNTVRGQVLAFYSVTQYAGWAAGNQLLHLAEPTSFVLFSAAAAFLSAAIVPLTVTTQDPPEKPATPSLPVLWLLKTSPIGVVGVFLIGLANGPFWTLTPVYAASVGLQPGQVGTFMTLLTLGSAALQIPIGRLSDRVDRRRVLVVIIAAAVATEITLAVAGSHLGAIPLYATAFLLGSVVSTQYYVLAAHVNDRIGRENVVGVAAVLLFVYCLGAIAGPTVAGAAMNRAGPGSLFGYLAIVHGIFALYVVWRMIAAGAPETKAVNPAVRSAT